MTDMKSFADLIVENVMPKRNVQVIMSLFVFGHHAENSTHIIGCHGGYLDKKR